MLSFNELVIESNQMVILEIFFPKSFYCSPPFAPSDKVFYDISYLEYNASMAE